MKNPILYALATLAMALSHSPIMAEQTGEGQPNPMRPTGVTWGGVSNNDQIDGSADQWKFTQKYMDAFLMHGAYWLIHKDEQDLKNMAALGAILKKHSKTAHLETGFGEGPEFSATDPKKRKSYKRAMSDIEAIKMFRDKYGIVVSKVRVDWFPMPAMAAYASKYKTTDMRQLMGMVCGSNVFGPLPQGFDPSIGNWREYATLVNKEFPLMQLTFDQAPCNHRPLVDAEMRKAVPWQGFGYGYERTPDFGDGRPIMLDGMAVKVKFDFADQLMGVILASREAKINFYGFEGDTPFNYFDKEGQTNWPDNNLLKYHLAIEALVHKEGLRNSRIINDSGKDRYGDNNTSLVLDLETPRVIDRIKIIWGQDYATQYAVKTSTDGKGWDGAGGQKGFSGGTSEIKFKKRLTKQIKLEFRVRSSTRGYQVAELEAYSSETPGVNHAAGAKARASSVSESYSSGGNKKNKGMSEVSDGDPKTYWESLYVDNDEFDKTYHARTLEYLEFWQGAGGRSDEYIAESWYKGPYTFFPDTKPGTFSNLAKTLIRRIRGINDDGTPMRLDLAMRFKGKKEFIGDKTQSARPSSLQSLAVAPRASETMVLEVQIRHDGADLNKGDARALPLLRCVGAAHPVLGIKCKDAAGTDITRQLACLDKFDGYYVGGLESGQSKTLTIEITAAKQKRPDLNFELYWNPQDPSLTPRDVFTLTQAILY